jgi:catechol 2,3-dioxygenase-like lactoylglutathione lyase family enzyme
MKLNHINLTVSDVRAAAGFLEKYFGLRPMGGNEGMAFLFDDEDLVLTLMKAGRSSEVAYPGNFHIGFFVAGEDEVDAIHRRLREDGFDAPPPERHNHGYGFYVNAPGGFTIESGA